MKKFALLILGCAIFTIGQSQIIIDPQLPPLGLVLKNQLWNLAVINTENQPLQVQIKMLVTDASNNQKIFSGTSKMLTLTKGLSEITQADVSPVTYNNLSATVSIDPSPDGFLPFGVYSVCYSINLLNAEAGSSLSQQCEEVEVQPISPPILVSPSDSENIEITRPMFNWLPPEPYNLFTGLTYQYNLVQVQQVQSGSEAIQQNVPIAYQQGLELTDLQYPISLPELDTGVLYAWQIIATNNGIPVSKSEVYTFRIKKLELDPTTNVVRKYFTVLKTVNDQSYVVTDGVLRFTYFNEINDTSIHLVIHDLNTAASVRSQLQPQSSDLSIVHGMNYETFDLSDQKLLALNHLYLMEFTNSRKEHFYLKFQYVKLPASSNPKN